jgi:leader peptidase (prepilin peptidase)/N-methyltransferase
MLLDEFIAASGIFLPVMSFILGAAWGSFLNVCIYRIPTGQSVVFPGSHCTTCGTPIRWYDNIPIVSYFLLGGHCRTCGASFSIRYAAIEALTGILFLLLGLRYGWQPIVVAHWVITCLLIIATFTDIDHFIIPDVVTVGGTLFSAVVSGLLGSKSFVAADLQFWLDILGLTNKGLTSQIALGQNLVSFAWSLVGAGFGWLLLWAIAVFGQFLLAKEAMGGGDVKLFSFLGAYFGLTGVIAILFLSAFIGAITGLCLLGWHKLFGRDEFDKLEFDSAVAMVPPYIAGRREEFESMQSVEDITRSSPPVKTIRVARRTSRQLHHFPYGPYIALAAVVLLFAFPQLHLWLREYLWLLPVSYGE